MKYLHNIIATKLQYIHVYCKQNYPVYMCTKKDQEDYNQGINSG